MEMEYIGSIYHTSLKKQSNSTIALYDHTHLCFSALNAHVTAKIDSAVLSGSTDGQPADPLLRRSHCFSHQTIDPQITLTVSYLR